MTARPHLRPRIRRLARGRPGPSWHGESFAGAVAAISRQEAAAGVTLTAGLVAALVWANVGHTYDSLWSHEVSWLPLGHVARTPRSLVNQGLMTVFFLGVGLEIGRERAVGSLQTWRNALTPVVAALGGMAGAAALYLLVAVGAGAGPTVRGGWGVPMATDVAFTLAAVALLGRRVPGELRVFVLALAVADDLASVAVLAATSPGAIDGWALAGAAGLLALVAALRPVIGDRWWPYVVAVVGLWTLLSYAGIEPPLAGAFVGVLVPCRRPLRTSPSGRLERFCVPASTLVVLPLFSLANTGISLDGTAWSSPAARQVLTAVMAARVVGKVIGIAAGCAVALAVGGARLPRAVSNGQLLGVAALCGIGFTVPLLFADAAFAGRPTLVEAAEAGLLAGSLLSFLVGATTLSVIDRRHRSTPVAEPHAR